MTATAQKTEPSNQREDTPPEKMVYIALMGGTGVGKSSFINRISGSNLKVSDELVSCTDDVQQCDPFQLGDRIVVLLDTPGFDDTNKTEKEILELIASFLEVQYQDKIKLHGVIYVHNINEQKMGGMAVKNFGMFRQLIGNGAMQNVVIVTNQWSKVTREVGDARVKQLSTDDRFYKPALDKGAKMMEHSDTADSAQQIVECIIKNTPRALVIQEELVDQRKKITETAAGQTLQDIFEEKIAAREKEIQELKADISRAAARKDEETRQELQEEAKKIQAMLALVRKEKENMAEDYEKHKREVEALRRALEEQNAKPQVASAGSGKEEAGTKKLGMLGTVVEAEAEAVGAVTDAFKKVAMSKLKMGRAVATKFLDVFD